MRKLLIVALICLPVTASDNPSFECGAPVYAGVTCTAFNVGDLEPHWETFVAPLVPNQKPAYRDRGWVVHILLQERWSLIVMTVRNGNRVADARAWGRKRTPTSKVELAHYASGETKGPGR